MADVKPGRTLEDILSCCLCMERYDTTKRIPKALPCQHTFCLPCLDKLNETAIANDQGLQCPTCKSDFTIPRPGAQSLPTNYSMQEMVEFHQNLRYSEEKPKHETADITCDEHSNKPVIMVCICCTAGLCTDCMKSIAKSCHINHELDDLTSYLAEYNTLCKENAELLSALCPSPESARNEQIRKIDNQQKSTDKEIDNRAEDAISKVRAWQTREKCCNQQVLHQARNDATKAAKDIQKEIDQANYILNSRKINPSSRLPIKAHVEEVAAKIPGLQTKCETLSVNNPPVYKLSDIDIRPYNRVLMTGHEAV